MKKKVILVWLVVSVFIQSNLFAQKPVWQINFDKISLIEKNIEGKDAVYMVDLLQSQYAEGLKGYALDLTSNATLRKPINIKNEELPDFSKKISFAVQIWVKTLEGAKMGTPIIGNKKSNNPGSRGWQIYTKENGAWALNVSDGKNRYVYQPTAERQRINDANWHQIVFSVDRKKQEIWMYLDGKNVAIYNTPDLKGLESEFDTVVGGSDEKWEYGSYAQWNAFNGFIDEVKIWDRSISSEEVNELYYEHFPLGFKKEDLTPLQLKVLAWNIWHGGHRYGQHVGVQRVIETIKSTNVDVIGLIETYGSGEIIADALGYYFYLVSTNLSIMSRYPISETIKAFKPFNFGGVKLKLGTNKDLVFFDTWLHYLPDYSNSITKKGKSNKELIADEGKTRHAELKEILKEIKPWLIDTKNTPVIMSGDFNIGSHLDWTESTKGLHFNRIIEWPESKEMEKYGFKDSYRELHINPLLDPGLTWTPRAATSSDKYGLRDRIDYIFYKGSSLKAIESKVIDYHPIMFPSDHAAVLTVFKLK